MRNLNKEKILAISFISIILIFSIPTLHRVNSQWINDLPALFSKLTIKSENFLTNSNDLKKEISSLETTFNDNVYSKNNFIEFNGLTQNILNKKVIQDLDHSKTIIKDSNGYLHFNPLNKNVNVTKNISLIKNLNEFCKSKNINFLYTQAPTKSSNNLEVLPIGINDCSNIIIDNFLDGLSKNSIPYLDLRLEMKKDMLNYKDLFLKADHHWTFEAGFWGYSKILKTLTENFNINLNNNFQINNYKNYFNKISSTNFLGSQGKRVGKYYANALDNLNLLIPKFETNLSCSFLNSKGKVVKNRNGDFYNSLINAEIFENNDIYSSKYESFLDSNVETRIINNLAPNDKKVLFIKDSFARPVAGYMSLNFKETRLLDRRTSTDNFYDYITEFNPDLIIMLYSGTNFLGYNPENSK